ncbi:DNA replication/repair protein RecF [bacterium]|nr:MAG: DNA replication/repair protein RecF [bacterium]
MRINQLEIRNFRNHSETSVQFAPHINLILGKNGSGKTNLIDAIHVLCMSRSFVTPSDQYVVQKGQSSYSINGFFSGSIRSDFSISCTYKRGDGKTFFVNESPLGKLSDLIGRVPIVVLSPQDRGLTAEGPTERRSFLDSMISQLSHTYLTDLMDYRKVIKQRNALLSNPSLSEATREVYLEPWNHQLAGIGAKIILKRIQVLNQFRTYLEQAYEQIASINLKPQFEYKSIDAVMPQTVDEITRLLLRQLDEQKEKEVERGYTTVGPHRDDLVFYLDDIELRKFGSQGQHRLFTIALKLAELLFLSEELDDLPIFLLDDMFGDLDPHKVEVILEMLHHHEGQTFITAANPQLFGDFKWDESERNSFFSVSTGGIVT